MMEQQFELFGLFVLDFRDQNSKICQYTVEIEIQILPLCSYIEINQPLF